MFNIRQREMRVKTSIINSFLVFLLIASKSLSRSLLFWVFLSGFLFSLFLLERNISQDYFSFLYIGKGVSSGLDMYKDFGCNKGPVVYLTYQLLWLLFKNNYYASLFVSSFLIDVISVYFFLRFLGIKFDNNFSSNKTKTFIEKVIAVFILTAIYKTFTVGIVTAGMFSENIAMMLVSLALYSFVKKREFISGVFFALAMLTRPTILPLIIILLTLDKSKNVFTRLSKFGFGFIVCLISVVIFLIQQESLPYMLDNFISFNFSYGYVSLKDRLANSIIVQLLDPRVILGIALLLTYTTHVHFTHKDSATNKHKFLFFALLTVSGILCLLIGTNIYDHHLLQFTYPLIFVVYDTFVNKSNNKMIVYFSFIYGLVILLLSLLGSTQWEREYIGAEIIEDVSEFSKECQFLQVVPQIPLLYLETDLMSPDRYFQHYFLSEKYNVNSQKHIENHLLIGKSVSTKTCFVFVTTKNPIHSFVIAEYKHNFTNAFKLNLFERVIYPNGYEVEYFRSEL